jgi:hypothetical protein
MFQVKMDQFKGVANNTASVDLVIVDIPDNLAIPNMVNGEIPTWNVKKARFLDTVFDFTNTHLQDDGAILLFHANSIKLKTALRGFQKIYHFNVHKEWMGVNWLRMTSAKEVGKTVSYCSP